MRLRCIKGGVWLALAINQRGERRTARIFRVRNGCWVAHHRINGRAAWTHVEPTLQRHRVEFGRVMNQACCFVE